MEYCSCFQTFNKHIIEYTSETKIESIQVFFSFELCLQTILESLYYLTMMLYQYTSTVQSIRHIVKKETHYNNTHARLSSLITKMIQKNTYSLINVIFSFLFVTKFGRHKAISGTTQRLVTMMGDRSIVSCDRLKQFVSSRKR